MFAIPLGSKNIIPIFFFEQQVVVYITTLSLKQKSPQGQNSLANFLWG